MSQLLDNRLGAENLQIALFKTVTSYVNSYLVTEEAKGNTIDLAVATAKGIDPSYVSLEQFQLANIHYGHRPSMIEASVSSYPSMSISTTTVTPSPENALADYGYSLNLKASIEFIVRSGPYAEDDDKGIGESIVGRRAKRTAEALHQLLQDHQALDGTFMPPTTPPTVIWGEIFARVEDGQSAVGPMWYWHGCRMEYIYPKQTVFGLD